MICGAYRLHLLDITQWTIISQVLTVYKRVQKWYKANYLGYFSSIVPDYSVLPLPPTHLPYFEIIKVNYFIVSQPHKYIPLRITAALSLIQWVQNGPGFDACSNLNLCELSTISIFTVQTFGFIFFRFSVFYYTVIPMITKITSLEKGVWRTFSHSIAVHSTVCSAFL